MWLSEQREQWKERNDAGSCAAIGPVTVPERPAAVWLEGERRGVECYGPGGYHWMPRLHQEVLVLKTGEGKYCAVGAAPEAGEEQEKPLEPGDIMIRTGKAVILLKPDGNIELRGTVKINGKTV